LKERLKPEPFHAQGQGVVLVLSDNKKGSPAQIVLNNITKRKKQALIIYRKAFQLTERVFQEGKSLDAVLRTFFAESF